MIKIQMKKVIGILLVKWILTLVAALLIRLITDGNIEDMLIMIFIFLYMGQLDLQEIFEQNIKLTK